MPADHEPTDEERADRVAGLATSYGVRLAVAESLTAGRISSFLGRGEAASEWYRGAVVAYGITGVGGPGPQEDRPPGTVHLAVATSAGTQSLHACLAGDPSEVVVAATRLALDELVRELESRG